MCKFVTEIKHHQYRCVGVSLRRGGQLITEDGQWRVQPSSLFPESRIFKALRSTDSSDVTN